MFTNIQSRCHGLTTKRKLYNSANGNIDFIQRLKLERKLAVHSGCVNTICWNDTGTTLLSGSDDQHLVISDPYSGKIVHKLQSGHRANIFSAKYLPGTSDREVISCSGDGKIIYNNTLREDTYGTNVFDCHFGTTYKVIVIPNEASTFLSCGEDGTVRFFDLRSKTSCSKPDCKEDVLINSRSAVTSIAANPLLPWQLAVGCSDSTARVYDRRMLGTRATGNYMGKGITGLVSLFTPPSLENSSYRITSLSYSPDGEDLLVSYSLEYIYLFATKDSSNYSEFNTNTGQIKVDQNQRQSHRDDDKQIDRPSSNVEATSDGNAQHNDQDESSNDAGARPTSVKRLRLRGDWSDTGPGSRPERERRQNTGPRNISQPGENPRTTIMQRMSDLLTRWLDGNMQQDEQPDSSTQSSQTHDQPVSQPTHSTTNQSVTLSHGSQEVMSMSGSQTEMAQEVMSLAGYQTERTQEEMALSVSQTERTQEVMSLSGSQTERTQEVISLSGSQTDRTQEEMTLSGSQTEKLHEVSPQTILMDDRQEPRSSLAEQTVSPPNIQDTSVPHSEETMDTDDANIPKTQTEIVIVQKLVGDTVLNLEVKPENQLRDPDMYNPLEPTSYVEQASIGLHHEEPSINDNNMKAKDSSISISKSTDQTHIAKPTQTTFESAESARPSTGLGASPDCYSTPSDSTTRGGMNPTPSCSTNKGGLSPEEQSIMQHTMQTVDELKSRNVAPMISLHYSSEGTSYSNIRLRFAPLDEEAGMQIGEGSGRSVLDSEAGLGLAGVSTQNEAPIDINLAESDIGENQPSNVKAEHSAVGRTVRSNNVQDSLNLSQSKTLQDDNRPNETPSVKMICENEQRENIRETSNDTSNVNVGEAEMCNQNKDGKQTVESQVDKQSNDIDMKHESPCTVDEQMDIKTIETKYNRHMADKSYSECDKQKHGDNDKDAYQRDPKSSEDSGSILSNDKDKWETGAMDISDSESVKVKPDEKHIDFGSVEFAKCDDDDNDSVKDKRNNSRDPVIKDEEMPGCSDCRDSRSLARIETNNSEARSAFKTYTKSSEKESGRDEAHSMDVDETSQSTSHKDQSMESTHPKLRQRRVGYSGPPTGDFQLTTDNDHQHSSSSSNSSDDDDGPRNVITRPRIDRTTAALRLQALHRKRQEAKEKKEMNDKSIYKPKSRKIYRGHRNARTMIKEANFWGNNFILSGSDCGHIFIWDRNSTKPVMLLEADKHVVNCVQPHPFDVLLASSGIDYDIKLWSPLNQESAFDSDKADTLIQVNEVMLEETRDTITVPAAFMLRVLASINNIRSGRRNEGSSAQGNNQGTQESDSD